MSEKPPGDVLVDFDGDGQVVDWEKAEQDRWSKDENLSVLLAVAIANSPLSSPGVVDISEYLASSAPATPESAEGGAGVLAPRPPPPPPVPSWLCMFKRGDVDRDGDCDWSDYSALSYYYYYQSPVPQNLDAADVNDDGVVDMADITAIANYLAYGAPVPPAPFSSFGLDPTYDPIELPCQDTVGFEHARNPIEESEIAVPPQEGPPVEGGMLPSGPLDSVDGTGGFGAVAPQLDTFAGPAGLRWGLVPSYVTRSPLRTDHKTAADFQSELGYGWFAGIPHIVDLGSAVNPRYWLRWSASCVRAYEPVYSGSMYAGRFANLTNLDAAGQARALYCPGEAYHNDYMLLYDFAGRVYVFYGWQAQSKAVKGRLRKIVAPGPSEIVLNWDLETGKLLTVEVKHGGAVCQTWTYTYGTALQNKHRLTEVTMTRAADEPPEEAKTYRVKLRYFADQYPGEVGGTTGDLMQIDVTESLTPFPGGMEDPKNKLARSWYYRYFTGPYTGSGDGAGYAHQVREVYGPDACRFFNLADYASTEHQDYAERIYEYCKDRRVWTLEARAASCCSGGNGGVYTYQWYLGRDQGSPDPQADDPGVEHALITVDQPHGDEAASVRRMLAYNTYGQITLDGLAVVQGQNPELYWLRVAAYEGTTGDTKWFPRHFWWPAAVDTGVAFDFSNPVACGTSAAPSFYTTKDRANVPIRDSAGKHRALAYSWTPPTLTTQESYGQGEMGTTTPTWYHKHTLNTDGQDGYRTRYLITERASYYTSITYALETYAYDFYTDSGALLAVKETTTTRQAIPTDQNGSGVPVTLKRWFALSGGLMWERDGRLDAGNGYLNFYAQDPVTFQTEVEVIDFDTSLPPIEMTGIPMPYTSRAGNHANAVTFHTHDGLGRTMASETEAGLSDDGNTHQRRTTYYVHTKITGDAAKLSPDLPATLVYPHVDASGGKLGEVSISVSTPGGKSLMNASGCPAGTATPFYDAEWNPAAETLGDAYEGVLISRSQSEYDQSTGNLTESRVWLFPNDDLAGWNSEFSSYYHYDTCGRIEKTEGPDIDSSTSVFRQIDKVVYDALGRPAERWTGSGDTDMLRVSKSFYDGAVDDTLVVGNGNLTRQWSYLNATEYRETTQEYDGQDRLFRTLTPFDGSMQIVQETIYVNAVLPRPVTTKSIKKTGASEVSFAETDYLHDKFGNLYGTDSYGMENGARLAPDRSRTWRDEAGNGIKTKSSNGTFTKSQFDGAGRETMSFLCFDADEADTSYAAAFNVGGDTVITQSVTVYDRVGQAIISASFERMEDAQGEGPLTNATALMYVSESYFDLLGRLDTAVDLGNIDVPSARDPDKPTATSEEELVTRHRIGTSLVTVRGLSCRWSYVQNIDGTVSGSESDALGRTVRQWTKTGDATGKFKVREFTHDAAGHQVTACAYKEYLTQVDWQFGNVPPEWASILKVMALPCTTQQVWGVKKGDGEFAWQQSAVSSTGLLREIHRPDPAGNEASEDCHRHFAYNAQGQIIGERLLVVGGETEVFIGRVMEYDMQGRTRRDAVVEGGESLPDDARALEWDYDVAGQLVSARTRNETEAVLNEVRFQYDGYGQAVNVWENHGDEVDPDVSFKVTTNYSAPAVQDARYVGRRPTSRTVNVNAQSPHYPLDVTLGYQPNTPSDFLCRAETHQWLHWDIAGDPDCWLGYRTVEKFAGTARWQSTEGHREYRNVGMEHSLNQGVSGRDTFLRPATFSCQQGYDPRTNPPPEGFTTLQLGRSYGFDASTARLSAITDSFLEENTATDPEAPEHAGRTATFNGFGEATTFTSTMDGQPVPVMTRGWRYDAAGNWKCFSGDFTEPPSPLPDWSRCYDRRNEIFNIGNNPDCGTSAEGIVEYDEAGRVIEHDHDPHGVDQKFFYDAWGRLAGYGPDTPDVRYRYDALGRLIRREGSYADYYYGPGCALLCACLSINDNYPQYYIRSFSSRRLLALHDGSYTGCSWYIVDALGEMYGLCDFEVTGSEYQRYRYAVKGSLDETVETPSSGYHTIIVYAGTAFGTESIRQGATEALNEGAAQISVAVGCGPFVFSHVLGQIPLSPMVASVILASEDSRSSGASPVKFKCMVMIVWGHTSDAKRYIWGMAQQPPSDKESTAYGNFSCDAAPTPEDYKIWGWPALESIGVDTDSTNGGFNTDTGNPDQDRKEGFARLLRHVYGLAVLMTGTICQRSPCKSVRIVFNSVGPEHNDVKGDQILEDRLKNTSWITGQGIAGVWDTRGPLQDGYTWDHPCPSVENLEPVPGRPGEIRYRPVKEYIDKQWKVIGK